MQKHLRTLIAISFSFAICTLLQQNDRAKAEVRAEPKSELHAGIAIGRAIEAKKTAYLCLNQLNRIDAIESKLRDEGYEMDLDSGVTFFGIRNSLEAQLMDTVWYMHSGLALKNRPEVEKLKHLEEVLRVIAKYFFEKHPNEMEQFIKQLDMPPQEVSNNETNVERGLRLAAQRNLKIVEILVKYRAK
jgi:hypothetical protein